MKKFLTIIAAVLVCTTVAFASPKDKKKANVAEVTFVTTIDCKNCVKKVEANLPYEKGVVDFKVKLEDQTVWIKYNADKTDVAKLAEAIKKLGYDAVELKK